MAGLRYESGREMPPGMQELYGVKVAAEMLEQGLIDHAHKEQLLEGILGEQPQQPTAAALCQRMPYCGDAPEREDRRMLFEAWAGVVRETVYRDVQRSIYMTGQFPKAIIAGGEYQCAFLHDTVNLAADGGFVWRGVPIITCGRRNKVSVVWAMDDIDLPKPPEGGLL